MAAGLLANLHVDRKQIAHPSKTTCSGSADVTLVTLLLINASTPPLREYILALVQVVAIASLITRLLVSGLARLYKYFFCYLIIDLLETLEPFTIPFRSVLYGWVFLAFQCIKLCFYVLIVFELYSVLLRDLKGIARLAQRYSLVALGISALLSVFVLTALPLPRSPLRKIFYVEIPIISSIVLFMLLIMAFLAYYPVPLHRNAFVYAIGYGVYFISKMTVQFIYNLHLEASGRTFSTILLYVGLGCIVFWTIFLSRAGERRMLAVGSKWSLPERQQQVLHHLRELNDSVLRARPK